MACGLAEHSNGKAACPHLCLCVSKVHLSSSLRMCVYVSVYRRIQCACRLCLSATVCGKSSSETKKGHMDTNIHTHRHIKVKPQLGWEDLVWWECYAGRPLLQQTWISHLYKAFSQHTLTHTHTPYAGWRMTVNPHRVSKLNTHISLYCTHRHYTLRQAY